MTKYEEVMNELRKYYREDNKDARSKLIENYRAESYARGLEGIEEFKGFFDRNSDHWPEILFMSTNFADRHLSMEQGSPWYELPSLDEWYEKQKKV